MAFTLLYLTHQQNELMKTTTKENENEHNDSNSRFEKG